MEDISRKHKLISIDGMYLRKCGTWPHTRTALLTSTISVRRFSASSTREMPVPVPVPFPIELPLRFPLLVSLLSQQLLVFDSIRFFRCITRPNSTMIRKSMAMSTNTHTMSRTMLFKNFKYLFISEFPVNLIYFLKMINSEFHDMKEDKRFI